MSMELFLFFLSFFQYLRISEVDRKTTSKLWNFWMENKKHLNNFVFLQCFMIGMALGA